MLGGLSALLFGYDSGQSCFFTKWLRFFVLHDDGVHGDVVLLLTRSSMVGSMTEVI